MAHTYEELHKMTVDELRQIAAALDDARLEGNTQMNKDHLLPLLCRVLGVEAHAHHEVVGVDKGAIKAQIRALKSTRDEAIAAGDGAQLRQVRRRIHRLKRALHKAAV